MTQRRASEAVASRRQPVFAPRTCAWCSASFTPGSSREQRCEPCRDLSPEEAGRCRECGSTVSGRDRWGDDWGGGCDRAEAIVSALINKL